LYIFRVGWNVARVLLLLLTQFIKLRPLLVNLHLEMNRLTGPIPSELGELTRLGKCYVVVAAAVAA
jgi:hypothetical protein